MMNCTEYQKVWVNLWKVAEKPVQQNQSWTLFIQISRRRTNYSAIVSLTSIFFFFFCHKIALSISSSETKLTHILQWAKFSLGTESPKSNAFAFAVCSAWQCGHLTEVFLTGFRSQLIWTSSAAISFLGERKKERKKMKCIVLQWLKDYPNSGLIFAWLA